MTRRWLLGCLGALPVLAAVAAVAVLGGAGCGKQAGALQFADVTRDDLVIGVEVSGELEAIDSTDIHPPNVGQVWNFKIASIATDGDDVKAGAPIVAFDPTEITRDLETMQNEALAAEKKLEQKRNDAALARRDDALKVAEAESALNKASLKAAGSSDLVAAVDLEAEKLDEDNAKLVLAGAKTHAEQTRRSDEQELAQLAEKATYAKHRAEVLMKSLQQMQVASPRDGTIVLPADWQGNKKKVGDNAWKGETVLQVVGLGSMQGKGIVDEVDLARVATEATGAAAARCAPRRPARRQGRVRSRSRWARSRTPIRARSPSS